QVAGGDLHAHRVDDLAPYRARVASRDLDHQGPRPGHRPLRIVCTSCDSTVGTEPAVKWPAPVRESARVRARRQGNPRILPLVVVPANAGTRCLQSLESERTG